MMDVTSSQFHCNTIDLETYHLCYKRWCIYCNSVIYCIFIIPDVCASACVCGCGSGGGVGGADPRRWGRHRFTIMLYLFDYVSISTNQF